MYKVKHKYPFFIFIFLLFCLYNNDLFIENDSVSEALIVGRLLESKKNGILSHSGLTGYVTDSVHIDDYNYNARLQFEIMDNIKNSESYPVFKTYDSHNGGQAILYGVFETISPLRLTTNIKILKIINIGLLSFVFTLLALWTKRNFGIIPCLTLLLFIAASSWIRNFSSSLWWNLWVLYVPFIVGLLYLEKQTIITYKQEKKLLFFLYLSIVFKCFMTGFEYILTTLVVGFIPILYYYIQLKKTFLELIRISISYMLIFIGAVLTSLLLLVFQIKQIKGSFSLGVQHVLDTFLRRTADVVIQGKTAEISSNQYIQILLKYINGNMFSWSNNKVPFLLMLLIIFCCCGVLLLTNLSKNKAIVISTLVSIVAPLSWYIVFIQHSAMHLHLNYIVWYIPFLPLGFICIGLVLKYFVERFNKSKL